MLDMRQVTKVYRTELVETHALRSLDLHVGEGEFVAVTGPSGSGKTTFLNIPGLRFANGKGLQVKPGALGMSLQTPRPGHRGRQSRARPIRCPTSRVSRISATRPRKACTARALRRCWTARA